MIPVKCTHPNLCVYCMETDRPKKLICLKHDIDINYHNLTKITNCQDHKIYKQLKESQTKVLKNSC